MNEVPELLIGGIYIVPIIIGLVELAKTLGMPTQYAPWANGVLSVVFYIVTVVLKQRPDLESTVAVILTAVLLFLVNSGVYNVSAKPAVRAARGE
jgi:hypothetical protein